MRGSTSAPAEVAAERRPSAVFLDRDGTIIYDRDYPADPEAVRLLPGAGEAVARLNREGIPVFIATNQSGIARGYFTEAEFRAVQERVEGVLAGAGARVDGVYHCPHGPDDAVQCDCRKPRHGLFVRAAAEHGVDLTRAAFIGDRGRDVVPGVELGGTGILVARDGDPARAEPTPPGAYRAATLAEAVDRLLGRGVSD